MNYRLAFLSGATSGLGERLSILLADRGIPLLLTGRNEEVLKKLQEQLQRKVPVTIIPANLCSSIDMENLLQALQKHAPDLIINCAGIGLYGDILSFPLEKQMEILQVNMQALTAISIEAARALKEQHKTGTIVNISSTAGFFTYPSFALYAASKRFVRDFSLAFDEELSPFGIRVLVCVPGCFESSFRQRAGGSLSLQGQMSLDTTAHLLLQQIEAKKGLQTIHLGYRILCFIASNLLPKRWVSRWLRKRIFLLLQKNTSSLRS